MSVRPNTQQPNEEASVRGGGDRTASDGAFVGRIRELGQLQRALEEALNGRGSVCLVSGPPGIGKSWLAGELGRRAAGSGAVVLWGRCWEAGGAPAYWPWVQSLRSYVRERPPAEIRAQLGDGGNDVAQMIPDLHAVVEGAGPPLPTDPEGARFRVFDSTAMFLRRASAARPILLVLDDLHAADVPSLLFLRFLVGELIDSSILVVGLYREEDAEVVPIASALADIAREPATRSLRLKGLLADESSALIEAIAGITPSDVLRRSLHRETEGNPLFLAEIVRLIAAEGGLEALTDDDTLRLTIPPRVREVIDRRLARLSAGCVRILTLAAVLGREFEVETLRELDGRSRDEVLALLDEAVGARVVGEVTGAPSRMAFSHAMIRDALYDGLPPGHRKDLHRDAGEVLERRYAGDPESHLAELARHFTEAAREGDATKAVEYATRAGDRAVRRLAYEEAVRLYRSGLRVADVEMEDIRRCRLLLALGDAQTRAGDTPAARTTFLQAAEIARAHGLAFELAEAALGYGGRFVWARAWGDPHLVPLLQEALDRLPTEDSPLRVRLMARLAGGPLRDTMPLQPRERMSEDALEMARRLGDPATLAYALDGRHCANMGPDVVERRLAIADELVAVAGAFGDRERAFEGHDYRLHALLELGELPAARREYRALARAADDLRQPAQLWFTSVIGVRQALFEGRFADAGDAIDHTLELGRSAQAANMQLAFDLQTYALRREQGRLDEVVDVVARAVDAYPEYPVWPYVLVDVLVELGRTDEAREAFDELAERGFPLYLEMQWLFGMSLMPAACAQLGDRERAATLYRILEPYAQHNATLPPELCHGSLSRELGILATLMSAWELAERHLGSALEMNSRMGAKPWIAYTHLDYARMLLDRDRPGDRERATEQLLAGLDISRAIGMVAAESRITALLGEESGSATAATAPPSGVVSAPDLPSNLFRREGEYWSISFEGEALRLRDSKGLRYLARLLAEPDREFFALELATSGAWAGEGPSAEPAVGQPGMHLVGGQGEARLDPSAKAAYRRRLEELRDVLVEAERKGDTRRAQDAREEAAFVARELGSAVGLGGRDRRASSDAERARVNVTKAIRSAIDRIRQHRPDLADHLLRTVHTGTFCSYVPDPRLPTAWRT